MRITRSLVGLLSAALLGLVPIAIASPAHAATATQVDFTINRSKAVYGDDIYFYGTVKTTGGGYVYTGVASLQVSEAGGAWRTVANDDTPSVLIFPARRAGSNAVYRVVYTGDATYASSVSANRALKVTRDLNERIKGVVFNGKVAPSYKRKPVVIQVKAGRWKKFKVIRTDRRSRWSIKLPARSKRTYFRAVVAGDKAFVKSISRVAYTYRY